MMSIENKLCNQTKVSNSSLYKIDSKLEELRERASLKQLESILKESDITYKDVVEICEFKNACYNRIKISGNQWYDLYLMCWKPGQASTIHDHRDSSCAFKILEGSATEIACELMDIKKRFVRKTDVICYSVNECCIAQDSKIHQIINTSETENLVTLHIYSPPLKMNVYEMDPADTDSNVRRNA